MSNNERSLLNFWEDQMKKSHTSSNYFFRKSPSHYHMMLLVMSAYKSNEKLSVIIDQRDEEGKLLFASQDGIRHDLTLKNLLFCYLKHPLMSFKVISAIHFEALKLWVKGVKLVRRSIKIKNNSTFEN